jgi:hypothetical protein
VPSALCAPAAPGLQRWAAEPIEAVTVPTIVLRRPLTRTSEPFWACFAAEPHTCSLNCDFPDKVDLTPHICVNEFMTRFAYLESTTLMKISLEVRLPDSSRAATSI